MNLTTVNHVCNNLLFKRILHTSPSDYWPLLLIVIGRCIFFRAFKCERICVSADWIWPTTTTDSSSSLFPAVFFFVFMFFLHFFLSNWCSLFRFIASALYNTLYFQWNSLSSWADGSHRMFSLFCFQYQFCSWIEFKPLCLNTNSFALFLHELYSTHS